MKASPDKSYPSSGWDYRARLKAAVLAGLLLVGSPTALLAKSVSRSTVNKLALNAYCDEARNKSKPLADGTISYKRVAELASRRALAEHPSVYSDSLAWKAKIVALLDQYGDEPSAQLCTENQGAHSSGISSPKSSASPPSPTHRLL
jgi:hypothetical protein